jgi:hypothetical protein
VNSKTKIKIIQSDAHREKKDSKIKMNRVSVTCTATSSSIWVHGVPRGEERKGVRDSKTH